MEAREFKERVLPVSRRIYRLALRILKNTHDAEDIAQEICMKLWDIRKELANIKKL